MAQSKILSMQWQSWIEYILKSCRAAYVWILVLFYIVLDHHVSTTMPKLNVITLGSQICNADNESIIAASGTGESQQAIVAYPTSVSLSFCCESNLVFGALSSVCVSCMQVSTLNQIS